MSEDVRHTSEFSSQPPDPLTLLDLINSTWISQAIFVAARLGVADALDAGPLTAPELAGRIDADAGALHRLLRALTAIGLCEEIDGGAFGLTPLGGLLRSRADGSLRAYALHWGGSMWRTWGGLLHSVKTGTNPRALVTRQDPFDSLSRHTEAGRLFTDAMTEIATLVGAGVARTADLSGVERLVDVGGGNGALIAALLRATPKLHGLLFDRPEALEGAAARLEAAGVAHRCAIAAGSFFDGVPPGADACLLKSVLHDWNDPDSRVILGHCREALPSGGRLFIVERLLPRRAQPTREHRFLSGCDLGMMVAAGGRERSEHDFRELLAAAGFQITRVAEAAAYFSVIEARRV